MSRPRKIAALTRGTAIKKKLLHCSIAQLLVASILVFITFNTATTFITATAIAAAQENLAPHQSGELLVKLKSSEKIYKFKFANDDELQELMNFYNNNPQVEYAEPNYLYQAALEPLDTYYTQQTYLSKIKANQAWDITTGSASVVIAIIDSGVDVHHPDLKNNIWQNLDEIPNNGIDDDENGYTDDVYGWDFVSQTNDVLPKLNENYTKLAINHGTVVAGIAASQGGNQEGTVGVSWSTKIMPLRALNSEGLGSTDVVARAIDYAVDKGADVINLSFVGQGRSLTLENAIQRAYQAGVLVVAAAGNEVTTGVNMNLPEHKMYPVCHDGPNGENWVLGVASTDDQDKLASFSNYGSDCVDLTAPGVRLFSTVFHSDKNSDFNSYYQTGWTGTSVSAPQVAGTAALIKSIKPNLNLNQIQTLILQTAQNIDQKNPSFSGQIGSGLLDVYLAVANAVSQQPTEKIAKDKIVTAAGQGGGPHIKVLNKSNLENEFFAFDASFRGGLSIAQGDVDNDSEKEIIVGLGKGTYPWVKVFSPDGILEQQFMVYGENFRGGVEVAVGDIDGDDKLEIITGAAQGGGPHLRVFDYQGHLKTQFFAFEKSFRGGIEVAAGDVNGDKKDEILVVPQTNYQPEVRIFNSQGKLLSSFLSYAPNFKKGLHIASGDLNNDQVDEIITGAGLGGGPHVRVFDFNGKLISQFFAFDSNFRGGVFVATGDTDADGVNEIITGAGPTGGPQVRVFDKLGNLKFQFFAYMEKFRGGVRVAL